MRIKPRKLALPNFYVKLTPMSIAVPLFPLHNSYCLSGEKEAIASYS
ncbi:MAG: hypothetical protein ACYTX0_43155 [Nostoc sp.]